MLTWLKAFFYFANFKENHKKVTNGFRDKKLSNPGIGADSLIIKRLIYMFYACVIYHTCFNVWWQASASSKSISPNFLYKIYPILACLKVLITHGKLSFQRILRPVKFLMWSSSVLYWFKIYEKFEKISFFFKCGALSFSLPYLHHHKLTVWHSCAQSAVILQDLQTSCLGGADNQTYHFKFKSSIAPASFCRNLPLMGEIITFLPWGISKA